MLTLLDEQQYQSPPRVDKREAAGLEGLAKE
jgi:hypothetical protein